MSYILLFDFEDLIFKCFGFYFENNIRQRIWQLLSKEYLPQNHIERIINIISIKISHNQFIFNILIWKIFAFSGSFILKYFVGDMQDFWNYFLFQELVVSNEGLLAFLDEFSILEGLINVVWYIFN